MYRNTYRIGLMASVAMLACFAPETGSQTAPADTANTTPIVVTKAEAEGSITIDRVTGNILTKADDRPEWADGLAVALLSERDGFYARRVGNKAAAEHFALKDTAHFEDLGFLGVDEEGLEVELEADQEFRMQAIADHLGIDREGEGDMGQTLAEAEMDLDSAITLEDQHALTSELESATGVTEEAEEQTQGTAQG